MIYFFNKLKLLNLLFFFLLVSSLDARENPFVPTQAFLEEKAAIIEKNENNKTETKFITVVQNVKVNRIKKDNKILLDYKPYKFISIRIYNKKLEIDAPNHELIKYFEIKEKNKIVIDYKVSNDFFTKTKKIKHPKILKIAIGDHPAKNFFRVVITMRSKLSKDNKITYENKLLLIDNLY
jgi:hypothetical protein